MPFTVDDKLVITIASSALFDTGLRVSNSIAHHGLDITRYAFLSGASPAIYVDAFNSSLFLSANEKDVKEVLKKGEPAGMVMHSKFDDDERDTELRIAFDFDGVLVDDEAERVFQDAGISEFHESEKLKAKIAMNRGPLHKLLDKISRLQQQEEERKARDPEYRRVIVTAIITARNAPADARLIHTLREWGIRVDRTFLLGGMTKTAILERFRPHIFFDDQKVHLDTASGIVPSVHVPFGELNESEDSPNGA